MAKHKVLRISANLDGQTWLWDKSIDIGYISHESFGLSTRKLLRCLRTAGFLELHTKGYVSILHTSKHILVIDKDDLCPILAIDRLLIP